MAKLKPIKCRRCIKGQLYGKFPDDAWCLSCGEMWVPEDFKPPPYVHMDDPKPGNIELDKDGYYIDDIDRKTQELLEDGRSHTVSEVAKLFHCSTAEARGALDRLVHIGLAGTSNYGPKRRWIGYKKTCADQSLEVQKHES